MPDSSFQEFDKRLKKATPSALEYLATHFEATQSYHELFEALKLQLRHGMGLELTPQGEEELLPDEQQQQLEAGLLEACEKVGYALLDCGKPRDAWMYLRALGNKKDVAQRLRSIPITDENIEQCIEVAFNEMVDPEWGYELILRHYGTCNAITTLGGYFPALSKSHRTAVAAVLVRHVYGELRDSIAAHLERENLPFAPETSVLKMITENESLLTGGNHHMDVSHLNSTLRFAEHIESARELQMAYEMSIYGSRLDRDLQYPGEPPFEEFFASHAKYFGILLNWDEAGAALKFFRQQADQVDAHFHGTQAAEVYIDLLARSGKVDEAKTALLRYIPPGTHVSGRAPTLTELCQQTGDFSVLQKIALENGDLLRYALASLEQTGHRG